MSQRLRIAVADDEALIRRYFQEILPDLGYDVVAVAADGAELIDACERESPDLVISDIRMPDVDGIEAALRIFAQRPTPIILVSAFHDEDLIARASQSHALAYLVKPIERSDLQTTIPLVLRNFQQIQHLAQETAQLRQSLEDRKLIEQAKGLVMKKLGLGEAEAHRAMQKMACDKNKKMIDVARLILATYRVP
jgi:response regulator NasT